MSGISTKKTWEFGFHNVKPGHLRLAEATYNAIVCCSKNNSNSFVFINKKYQLKHKTIYAQ